MTMVREEMRRALESRGISESELVGMLLRTFEAAERAAKPAEMRAVVHDLAAWLEVKPEDGPYRPPQLGYRALLASVRRKTPRLDRATGTLDYEVREESGDDFVEEEDRDDDEDEVGHDDLGS